MDMDVKRISGFYLEETLEAMANAKDLATLEEVKADAVEALEVYYNALKANIENV